MSDKRAVVIIGGGLAGAQTAVELREQGYAGRIHLVGEEPHHPYLRPPLSKDYLTGKADAASIAVRPDAWYAEHEVDLVTGRVTRIDRMRHRVELDDQGTVPYDKAVIATGSTPRRLRVPGADLDGVLTLRTVDDSDRLRQAFTTAERVVIVGGGWIGLEVASAAHQAGVDVAIVETAGLPLARVLGARIGQFFVDLHRDHGVDWHLGAQVDSVLGTHGHVTAVRLADGTELEGDLVVVGVGIEPRTELALKADLLVDNGVVVDEHLRTSDPDIYAVGDVANAFHPFLARRIRVEHWANARYQPAVAAAGMLGQDAVYDRLPFFYSDQYDLGLEYTGYAAPGDYDDVVTRGDIASRQFIAFWVSHHRVLAGMNVNVWGVTDQIADLVHSGRHIEATRLTDLQVPLAAA